MSSWTPEAMALSGELAELLQQPVIRDGNKFRIQSRTEPGVYYTVIVGIDGEVWCNCGGFEHRGTCWHSQLMKEEGMTTALTTIQVQPPTTALPSKAELQSMDMVAAHLIESQAVAIPQNLKTKEDVRAVIFAGWEFGVKPMTALRHIAIVNGKTEPDGQLMAGIVLAKEPDCRFIVSKETDDSTTVRLTRPSRHIDVEYTVTMDDAKRAGLLGGFGWSKYPRDMRRWHAMKRLCRAYAPDLINGIASATLGDLPAALPVETDDDDYIEGEVQHVSTAELYSPGDEPEEEQEASDPRASEPEGQPPASPPATQEQKAAVRAALTEMAKTWDADSRAAWFAQWREKMPHVFLPTRTSMDEMTAFDAGLILAALQPAPPVEQATLV